VKAHEGLVSSHDGRWYDRCGPVISNAGERLLTLLPYDKKAALQFPGPQPCLSPKIN
jgi:hypothetical protein